MPSHLTMKHSKTHTLKPYVRFLSLLILTFAFMVSPLPTLALPILPFFFLSIFLYVQSLSCNLAISIAAWDILLLLLFYHVSFSPPFLSVSLFLYLPFSPPLSPRSLSQTPSFFLYLPLSFFLFISPPFLWSHLQVFSLSLLDSSFFYGSRI